MTDAVAVTEVVQTELDKRANKHGMSKQMIEQMQKKMTDNWVKMMERHEGFSCIEKYKEAKKKWTRQQCQIRAADKQFAEQVEKAGQEAYLLVVPDKEYWDVICPVCGCPVHTEEGGVCWSETVETITDKKRRCSVKDNCHSPGGTRVSGAGRFRHDAWVVQSGNETHLFEEG